MVFQNHGVFGVVQTDRKDAEQKYFPSLFYLAGQTLACFLVKAVHEYEEANDELWEDEEWKKFRKFFHEVQYSLAKWSSINDVTALEGGD